MELINRDRFPRRDWAEHFATLEQQYYAPGCRNKKQLTKRALDLLHDMLFAIAAAPVECPTVMHPHPERVRVKYDTFITFQNTTVYLHPCQRASLRECEVVSHGNTTDLTFYCRLRSMRTRYSVRSEQLELFKDVIGDELFHRLDEMMCKDCPYKKC